MPGTAAARSLAENNGVFSLFAAQAISLGSNPAAASSVGVKPTSLEIMSSTYFPMDARTPASSSMYTDFASSMVAVVVVSVVVVSVVTVVLVFEVVELRVVVDRVRVV